MGTLQGDTRHHLQILKQILRSRSQNMVAVESKIQKYYSKNKHGKVVKTKSMARKQVISIKFDQVSKMHLFTKTCLVSSYKAAGRPRPRIVYSSLPKVMARLYTKRAVLRKVRAEFDNS